MPITTEAPRLYPALRYKNAAKMIDWFCEAFGFSVRARHGEGDVVHHAELVFGSSMIMLGTVRDDDYGKMVGEPGTGGGNEPGERVGRHRSLSRAGPPLERAAAPVTAGAAVSYA